MKRDAAAFKHVWQSRVKSIGLDGMIEVFDSLLELHDRAREDVTSTRSINTYSPKYGEFKERLREKAEDAHKTDRLLQRYWGKGYYQVPDMWHAYHDGLWHAFIGCTARTDSRAVDVILSSMANASHELSWHRRRLTKARADRDQSEQAT